MNGGYVMIDCTGLDLIKGSTEQSIPGLFKRIEEAEKTGKPLFANNCNWDGTPVSPIEVFAIKFGDDLYICTASTLQIHVTSANTVTIVNMVGE